MLEVTTPQSLARPRQVRNGVPSESTPISRCRRSRSASQFPDPIPAGQGWLLEGARCHPYGVENPFPQKLWKGLLCHILKQQRQDSVAPRRVNELRPWDCRDSDRFRLAGRRICGWFGIQRLLDRESRLPAGEGRVPTVTQACGMAQQAAKRYFLLFSELVVGYLPRSQPVVNVLVECKQAFLDQHQRSGRRHRLSNRTSVKESVWGYGLAGPGF